MTRQEVYDDIKANLGVVPTFLKEVPDATIELEWQLMKKLALEETAIPNKYRELIGVALSGVMKCRYCAYYHAEVAKLFGATEEEIEEANHLAKHIAGWSTYINGMQMDYDQFKKEIDAACNHVRSAMAAEAQKN